VLPERRGRRDQTVLLTGFANVWPRSQTRIV
jgi:hypothetical protein